MTMLGDTLQAERKRRGVTMTALATALNMPRGYVVNVIWGRVQVPNPDRLAAIVQWIGYDPGEDGTHEEVPIPHVSREQRRREWRKRFDHPDGYGSSVAAWTMGRRAEEADK